MAARQARAIPTSLLSCPLRSKSSRRRPRPIGRAIAATIAAVFFVALAWACLGHVDIVATAQGKIVPTGRTKVIQPLETGIVTAIHVLDGDRVAAGQVLVEIDRTISTAERNRIAVDLLQARLDVARLSALRAGLDSGLLPAGFSPPAGAPDHRGSAHPRHDDLPGRAAARQDRRIRPADRAEARGSRIARGDDREAEGTDCRWSRRPPTSAARR